MKPPTRRCSAFFFLTYRHLMTAWYKRGRGWPGNDSIVHWKKVSRLCQWLKFCTDYPITSPHQIVHFLLNWVFKRQTWCSTTSNLKRCVFATLNFFPGETPGDYTYPGPVIVNIDTNQQDIWSLSGCTDIKMDACNHFSVQLQLTATNDHFWATSQPSSLKKEFAKGRLN